MTKKDHKIIFTALGFLAVIIRDGICRMYEEVTEDVFYYLTLYNDNYAMLPMPAGVEEGILRGLYKLRPSTVTEKKGIPKVHLFGSGPILLQALKAQELLADGWGVAADVWSATSYRELRRDALEADRWNLLHPDKKPRKSYLETVLEREPGVFIAASDYVRQVPEMIARWVPGGLYPLGVDGFGRSESRAALRRHFEIDAECIAVAALSRLMKEGGFKPEVVKHALQKFGINPDKVSPMRA